MWVEAAPAGTLGLAWDVTPGDPRLAVPAAVLEAAAGHIRHIRLHGGGPETMGQEGLGVGRLMSALALSGYTGALALAPSNPRFRYAWGVARPEGRLGVREQDGIGYGGHRKPGGGAMNDEKRVVLDVRPVPKDRFEMIMGAYEALEPGQS